MQKKWLEQRDARKRQLMQARLSSNLTDDQWWTEYYRYYRHDLNKNPPNSTKTQRKPAKLGIRLKSKRKKQQQPIQTNSVFPNESLDISTPTTISTTATLPITPFVIVESTTAGITKSTDELQPSYRDANTTSEINSSTQINDRMSLNESSTGSINEISTTTQTPATTEHSITYNVTVNNSNRVQTVRKPKPRKLSNAVWGRWQKWTKCSRSCGGGIMSQSRDCLSR